MIHGIVFDCARCSFFDGPGIRTTVFLKGCPLHCPWCHNPEGKDPAPQRSHNPHTGCIKTIGKRMSTDQVMAAVIKDKPYYLESGGGLTLSGGEPLFQYHFAAALAKKAHALGIHVAIETSGAGSPAHFNQISLYTDLWLYDFKISDPGQLKTFTGADYKQIEHNFNLLYRGNQPMIMRCPLIPGINDTIEHIRAICAKSVQYDKLLYTELMPYHTMGISKAKNINAPYPMAHLPGLDNPRDISRIKKMVNQFPRRKIIVQSREI